METRMVAIRTTVDRITETRAVITRIMVDRITQTRTAIIRITARMAEQYQIIQIQA